MPWREPWSVSLMLAWACKFHRAWIAGGSLSRGQTSSSLSHENCFDRCSGAGRQATIEPHADVASPSLSVRGVVSAVLCAKSGVAVLERRGAKAVPTRRCVCCVCAGTFCRLRDALYQILAFSTSSEAITTSSQWRVLEHVVDASATPASPSIKECVESADEMN
jgi:hypothetical protein